LKDVENQKKENKMKIILICIISSVFLINNIFAVSKGKTNTEKPNGVEVNEDFSKIVQGMQLLNKEIKDNPELKNHTVKETEKSKHEKYTEEKEFFMNSIDLDSKINNSLPIFVGFTILNENKKALIYDNGNIIKIKEKEKYNGFTIKKIKYRSIIIQNKFNTYQVQYKQKVEALEGVGNKGASGSVNSTPSTTSNQI
jgi:hypothetical protein